MFRSCATCGKSCIDPSRPEYVKHCPDCYKTYKDSMRECITCHQKKIPSSLPDYMKKCRACYQETRTPAGAYSNSSSTFSAPPSVPAPAPPPVQPSDILNFGAGSGVGRQCEDCKQNTIPSESQAYVVRCNRCYQLKKYKESGGILDL